MMPFSFTVATYNVQCLESNTQLEPIAAEIRGVAPDLIGIQELDVCTARNGVTCNQVRMLAEKAAYPYFYFGKAIDFEGGGYGHCLLSKYPLLSSETIPLPVPPVDGDGGRCATRCEILLDGKHVIFYNCHLPLGSDKDRAGSFRILKESMQADTYAVLTGDFNTGAPGVVDRLSDASLRVLNGGDGQTPLLTYPEGDKSAVSIDNIVITRSLSVSGALCVSRTRFSDHNMLYATLHF